MLNKVIPQYLDTIWSAVTDLKDDTKVGATQALTEVLASVNANQMTVADANLVSEETQHQIQTVIDLDWNSLSYADKRNLIQLAILKAEQADGIQANEQLTPDGIGYLLGDLIYQTAQPKSGEALTDLTVGSGNLLWTVDEVLRSHDVHLKRLGFDNNPEQLGLATVADELLHSDETDLYQADVIALPGEEIPPADLVIGDLPVGFYPVSLEQNFVTSPKDGKPFAHFLLIEQALKAAKESGWVYLIVPSNLFEGADASRILTYLASHAQLQAFLKFPTDFFKNQAASKAVLVIRHKGQAPEREVLMGQYPSLKDPQAFESFLQEIKGWVKLDKE
ncbi:class I SAM-dependent methyltransferase [Leuconostocaceae bacterium ESL0723]|nr:class I SAM-dependent methyltransferase [Leuconostocaceae bacterium ESL0723]